MGEYARITDYISELKGWPLDSALPISDDYISEVKGRLADAGGQRLPVTGLVRSK